MIRPQFQKDFKNLGRYDEALIFFTSSIKANYEFPRSLNNLGNTMRKKNEIARAIGCYEQAIKTHNCLMQTESNNVLSAIENLQYAYENNHQTIIQASREKGLDYLVEHDQIIYAIATIESKEYTEGIDMIEQIDIEQNPVLCYYMALCKMRKNELQESLNYCERVKQLLEIHPRKIVCRLYSERIQLVLEQIELIEQEQRRQQMYLQRIQQSSQANQDLTQEDEEDDKPIYVQLSLKNYNKNSNSLEKKKRQTEQFQRAYLRAASSQQKSDQNTNSSININHRHQESIGSNMNMSIFKIADNSSLRINANHPILNSPQLSSRGGRAFTPLKERITQSFINIQNKIQQLVSQFLALKLILEIRNQSSKIIQTYSISRNLSNQIQQTFSNATGQQILQQADILKSQQQNLSQQKSLQQQTSIQVTNLNKNLLGLPPKIPPNNQSRQQKSNQLSNARSQDGLQNIQLLVSPKNYDLHNKSSSINFNAISSPNKISHQQTLTDDQGGQFLQFLQSLNCFFIQYPEQIDDNQRQSFIQDDSFHQILDRGDFTEESNPLNFQNPKKATLYGDYYKTNNIIKKERQVISNSRNQQISHFNKQKISVSSRPRDISLSIKNVEELYQSSGNALDLQKSFRTSSNNQNQNYRGFSPMPDMGGSQPFDNRSDRSNITHSYMQQYYINNIFNFKNQFTLISLFLQQKIYPQIICSISSLLFNIQSHFIKQIKSINFYILQEQIYQFQIQLSDSKLFLQQNTPTPAQQQNIKQSHQFILNKYRDNSMILVDDDNNINISKNLSYNISSQQQNSNYINFRKKSNQTNIQYNQGINIHSNKTVQEADNDKEDDIDISGFDYKVDQTDQSNYLSNQIQL